MVLRFPGGHMKEQVEKPSVFTNRSVLIVDDHEIIRTMLHKLLTPLGFASVDEAPDGSSALRMLDRKAYSVIICDINMEPVSGLDFVSTLRKGANIRFDAKRARTPVLFLTGSADKEHILGAKGLGVRDYLLKPIDAASLKARLIKILSA
jgi:two-component system chemotaxis response regulator CheY